MTTQRASKRARQSLSVSRDDALKAKKSPVKNTRVRVWWPPTDDSKRTGYSGAYWPAKLLGEEEGVAQVQYDNGDKESVVSELLQPSNPPLGFGKETKPLKVGEFVEVHNNSKTDPAEWVGVIKQVKKGSYKVSYPFHDAEDDEVKVELLRRARVFDTHLSKWLLVQPFQKWEDGEVTSPVELYLCTEKELFLRLADKPKKTGSSK